MSGYKEARLFSCAVVWLLFITALGQGPPVITRHPSDDFVAKTESHTMSCGFTSDGTTRVVWYKNGRRIMSQFENPRSIYTLDLNNGDLFILTFTSEEAGWYYCNVTNEYGSATSNNATIQIAVLTEEFIVHPSSASAVVGASATMRCEPPVGTPPPQVLWKKDDSFIDVDREHRVSILSTGSLRIRVVAAQDEGVYKCVAKNEAGEYESAPAFLTVLEAPDFVETPIDLFEKEGLTAKFKCKARGDPMPNITWVKNNDKLDRVRSQVMADGSLVIRDIDPSDDGAYTCTITNSGGSKTAVAYLTVYTAPVFLQRPTSKSVRRQTTVRFRCVLQGNPPPVLSWSKNQDDSLNLYVRQSKGRFSVLQDGSLQINNTREADNGEYRCYASNAAGTIEALASLRVRDEGDAGPPPVLTKLPRNQTVTLTDDVELECKASGNPSPTISWSHNRLPVLDHSRVSINRGSLRISDVKVTDAGEYTCLAVSESGEASASAFLNVLGAKTRSVETLIPSTPEKPSTRPQDITGTSVKLYWGASSSSSDDITYSVQYFTLDDKEGWQTAATGITGTWVDVTNLDPGTSYLMLVRAHNSYGTSEPSPLSDYIRTSGQRTSLSRPWSESEVTSKLEDMQTELESVQVLTSTDVNVTWRLANQHKRMVQGFYVKLSNHRISDKVYGSSSNYHIVSNLNPFTPYNVMVTPFYHQYAGRPSNVQAFTTLEDAPSGPPLDVKVKEIDSNTIQVSWDPPKFSHQNGVITGYVIVCEAEDPQLSKSFPVYANITNVALENLNRNTEYKIGVAASTSVGTGPTSRKWPIKAIYDDKQEDSTWWKHTVIGALGGLVWVVLCILIICLCRRHRARRKANKQSVNGDTVSVALQPTSSSNGLFLQYQLDHTANSQQASGSHPHSVSQHAGAESSKFYTSYNEDHLNMDNYDEPQLKTFYNKSDSMSTGPYATTVILNNMPERDETGIPKESPHATLNTNLLHHGSESSCTDNNACRTGAISNSSGERASPPVLPSFTDMLPPPPLYPPPPGASTADTTPANFHTSARQGQPAALLGTMPRMGTAHCHTCHRGYHNSGMGVGPPRAQYTLDNQGRVYNPTLPHIHSFPGSNEYQTTYPSMPRAECKHSYQPYNICSPHGHSSDSHDYAEPHFECAADHNLYGGIPPLLQHHQQQQQRMRGQQQQPITAHHHQHHSMQHVDSHKPLISHQHSMPAHLHSAQYPHTDTQAPPGGRHNSLPSSEHSHELCLSCAEHTEYDEPWSDQHWSMIWDPNHAPHQHLQQQLQQQLQHTVEDEDIEDGEGAEETPMLAREQGSAASSAEGPTQGVHGAQSRSGSEDSKSDRQRQKRRQRAQQLPVRSSSPYNGYSTDSSVVFVPRKPYPKSQRKKQMNTKPKSTKSLAVQVEQEEIPHDKV